MNILFLDQFSDLGGAQRVLLDTVDAALERGWNAWTALPAGGPLIEQLGSRNVPLIEIPSGPYRSRTKGVADWLRFGSDLRKQNRILEDLASGVAFDLIYVNGPRLLPAAATLAARRRLRVLFHAHSHIPQRVSLRLAGRSIRRAAAAVAACSHSVLASFLRYADPAKLCVIPNGVPEIEFRRRESRHKRDWRIGLIGRIGPEKGQAEFVRAAALLHARFPSATFVICGAPLFAEPAYYETVRRLAQGLPVEFLGWREDVAPVLAGLDLLAAPSGYEGMGRVIIEAFSAGVPVVAFPSGGIPEVVIDGKNGFLTPDRSPEALAARIAHVMTSDPGTLETIVANARRNWEQCYTLEIYQQRITDWMERQVSGERVARETTAPQRRK
ncbi:MAG TPA: glycosyltransferase family 4 protein [Bryobacteraceae bacterium]|nr:glycosyltransferase family 4 protein [Bryobacteraceae bacterium]